MDQFNISHKPLELTVSHKYLRYMKCNGDPHELELINNIIGNKALILDFKLLKTQPNLVQAITDLIQEYPEFGRQLNPNFFAALTRFRLFSVMSRLSLKSLLLISVSVFGNNYFK